MWCCMWTGRRTKTFGWLLMYCLFCVYTSPPDRLVYGETACTLISGISYCGGPTSTLIYIGYAYCLCQIFEVSIRYASSGFCPYCTISVIIDIFLFVVASPFYLVTCVGGQSREGVNIAFVCGGGVDPLSGTVGIKYSIAVHRILVLRIGGCELNDRFFAQTSYSSADIVNSGVRTGMEVAAVFNPPDREASILPVCLWLRRIF